ncbi:MAG: aminotransferase class V-fold PLP-dependent enzyme [Congregibacter sp.]
MTSEPLSDGWPSGEGYLLNHSAGLPPLSSRDALQEGLFGPWTASDDQVWTHWMGAIAYFREQLAKVINHDAAMLCPQPSVSSGLSQILSALPTQASRKRLLIAERAFPSLGFVFKVAERQGFEVVMVPKEENTLDPDVWAGYLDERVHCVVFTHVHSNTSECHDITPLCELARNCGAISVVDVAQSIGIRRVDAREWNPDFIVGSCLKWLCGGSGAGFLWVNPARVADCEPADVGWFSHRDPFEFDIHNFEYAPDALRFWGGTPSVAPALVAAHSIEALLEVGLDRIEAHNRALGALISNAASPHVQRSPLNASERGGTVVLHCGGDQLLFTQCLTQAAVQFDERREGVRLSPHLYNTEADVTLILRCLPRRARN